MTCYLFDMDGTLIASYLDDPAKDFHRVAILPRRQDTIAQLLAEGHDLCLCTNQAGVAFKWKGQEPLTEPDVQAKIERVISELGLPSGTPVAVCFAHGKSHNPLYNDPREVRRRKPCGAMIHELRSELASRGRHHSLADMIMVGDRDSDRGAAEDAGCGFIEAWRFFGDPEPAPAGDPAVAAAV